MVTGRTWLVGPLIFMFILGMLSLLTNIGVIYSTSIQNYIPSSPDLFSVTMLAVSGMVVGIMVLVITVVSLGALAGTNVFGSGLNASGTMILIKGTLWLGIWAILSAVSYAALTASFIGMLVWLIVSFVYAIGASEEIFSLGGVAG